MTLKREFKGEVSRRSFTIAIYFALIFFICQAGAYAMDIHPAWVQEHLTQVDELNKKDPGAALSYAQEIYDQHHQNMSDFDKAALLTKMGQHNYILGRYKKSQDRLSQAVALNLDLSTDVGIRVLITQGGIYDELGKSEQAMEQYLLAEEYAKANENPNLLADVYAYIAYSYSINHNDIKALQFYHQAYLLFEKVGDHLNMAYLKAEMANSYSLVNDDANSIKLATQASEYFQKHGYFFDEMFIHNSLARIHFRKADYQNAELAYLRVIKLTEQINKPEYVYLAYLGLAHTYHNAKQLKKARLYWDKYVNENPQYESPIAKLGAITLEAKLALAENDIRAAEDAIARAEHILAPLKTGNTLTWHTQLLDLQANIAVIKKDYKTAFAKQKKARTLLKTYHNTERETLRSKYKIMFDTDQALLENKLLAQEKALSQAALENAAQKQKLQVLIITAISLFVLILIYFIYRQILNSKTLHKIANTDSLTELANRRYTFLHADKYLAKAKKSNQPFSLIIFDVDHFKQVNDTFGHAGGDIALKALSATAHEYVRSHDILGRIGGEEFLLVLPNAAPNQAYEIAERIRQAIANKVLQIQDKALTITTSFGVSSLSKDYQDFNSLFNAADMALYQAKNQGRNRVIIAS